MTCDALSEVVVPKHTQHVVLSAATGAALPVLGNGAGAATGHTVAVSKNNIALCYFVPNSGRAASPFALPMCLRYREAACRKRKNDDGTIPKLNRLLSVKDAGMTRRPKEAPM